MWQSNDSPTSHHETNQTTCSYTLANHSHPTLQQVNESVGRGREKRFINRQLAHEGCRDAGMDRIGQERSQCLAVLSGLSAYPLGRSECPRIPNVEVVLYLKGHCNNKACWWQGVWLPEMPIFSFSNFINILLCKCGR